MAIDILVQPMLRVPLFRALKPLQITEIVRRADRAIYRPGDVIIRDQEAAEAAILIVSGDAVRILAPERRRPAEPIVAGSLLAEMAMLIETEHTSTVVARSAVRALRISRTEMLRQMADDPALAHHFVDHISGRLSRLAEELRLVDGILGGSSLELSPAAMASARRDAPAATSLVH